MSRLIAPLARNTVRHHPLSLPSSICITRIGILTGFPSERICLDPFKQQRCASSNPPHPASKTSKTDLGLTTKTNNSDSGPSVTNSKAVDTRPDHDKLNGPPSTLPAPLELPSREPNQSTFKYLYRIGKTYLAFYKTGIKNLWANYKASRSLYEQLLSQHISSVPDAVQHGILSRREFQLLHRNRHDMLRVPPFLLAFIILGEYLPLVVIFMTPVVPWTCRIPKQVERQRRKLEERRRESFRNAELPAPPRASEDAKLEKLSRAQLVHISRSLGLHASIWDRFEGLGLPPTSLLRRGLKKRIQYLDLDDGLIKKHGGADLIVVEELSMALVERGIDVLGKTEQQLRDSMKAWLRARETTPLTTLFLTRPSVWTDQGSKEPSAEAHKM